ncbi:hypothetical protein JOM56_005207 [Amanita muscaria]
MVSDGSKPEAISYLVHRKLDSVLKSVSVPNRAYESLIPQLIEHKLFDAADSVYRRMLRNGIVPSMILNAQMLAVSVAVSPKDEIELLTAFEDLFTNTLFTEDDLLQTLQLMLDLGAPHNVVLDVIEKFIEMKSGDYTPGKLLLSKLVDLQVRNDKLKDALESLERFNEDVLGHRSELPPQLPYVALMTAIRDTNTWDNDAINSVLQIMRQNRVEPSAALFNILISGEIRERHLDQAFLVYAMLQALRAKNSSVVPDVFTFGSLFKARALWPDEIRVPKGETGPIIPLRQLFFEMLEVYQSQVSVPHPVSIVDTVILNSALTAFLREYDYSAAFIVIRTFGQLFQEVNVKTYYILMKHIMKRIRRDVKRVRMRDESRWGDRFLAILSQEDVCKVPINDELAKKVLAFGKQANFDITREMVHLDVEKEERIMASRRENLVGKSKALSTPTLEMMDGEEPVPENPIFSVIPLKRLLKRAVLANLMNPKKRLALRTDAGKRYYEKWVLEEIKRVEQEMVPER